MFSHLGQVWLVSYPEEPQLKCFEREDSASLAAASSTFSPGPDLFHRSFPFHLVLDADLRVVQLGSGLRRMLPGLSPGVDVQKHLEVLCRVSMQVHPNDAITQCTRMGRYQRRFLTVSIPLVR